MSERPGEKNTPLDTSLSAKKGMSKKARQRAFLSAFAEHANVLLSAKAAGISRQVVYQWLEHDEAFSFAYHQAKEDARDVIRAEIYRRGSEGWDEPVYQLGKYAGKVRKYSDTLLIFHAKMLMPEYRDKHSLEVKGSIQHSPAEVYAHLSDEELDEIERVLLAAQERMNGGGSHG
jgi:hypothetical protein